MITTRSPLHRGQRYELRTPGRAMLTPGHAIVNLTVLGRRGRPELVAPVLLGAVLPDIPMFLFYFWYRAVLHVPEAVIWSERYFEPGWQRLIDICHSLPLGLVVLVVA